MGIFSSKEKLECTLAFSRSEISPNILSWIPEEEGKWNKSGANVLADKLANFCFRKALLQLEWRPKRTGKFYVEKTSTPTTIYIDDITFVFFLEDGQLQIENYITKIPKNTYIFANETKATWNITGDNYTIAILEKI